MAEWEWDEEGNEYVERILKKILPLLLSQTEEALKEALRRARYFVSFEDLTRFMLSALEEKVRLTPQIKEFISKELRKIYEKAQMDLLRDFPVRYEFTVPDQKAVEYAEKLNDFYLGRFFRGDRELRLRALRWMSRYYLEQGNPIGRGQKGVQEFLERFGEYIKPQTEWKARQIIDTSVNFLRNSARIRAMQKAGIRKFRWDAVGDRLMCKACRSMDGRIFEVKEAARVLDTIESSGDPSILKEVRPIITTPFKGFSTQAPVKSPPLHPHCRCRVVSWIEELEEELPVVVERPPGVPDTPLQRELEEEYGFFTRAELTNRIRAHLGSEWARPPAGAKNKHIENFLGKYAEAHFKKHGVDVGAKTLEEYKRKAFEIIQRPEKVYVERNEAGTYYVFFKGGLMVVSSDDNLSITSFYRIEEEEWIRRRVQSLNSAILRIL